MTTTTDASHRSLSRADRFLTPGVGALAFALTGAGLSGIGDAPAPDGTPAAIAMHFQQTGRSVIVAAPLGIVGALALAGFAVALALRLHRISERVAAIAVAAGGVLAGGYLLFTHVIYTSLAYNVGSVTPDITKALFVLTILATPVFGLGVAITLGGAARCATASEVLPRWWTAVTVLGAATSSVATFSYADTGFFSPDVQQQVVVNLLLLWLLTTAAALVMRDRSILKTTKKGT